VVDQLGLAFGKLVGDAGKRQGPRVQALGDGCGTRDQLRQRLAYVPFLELVGTLQAVTPAGQDGRHDALHHVPHEATGDRTVVDRTDGGLDGAAAAVAENHDQWHIERRHRVFDGAQHCRINGLSRGANHEHVTQALVEDELGGHPAVRTAEDDRARLLAGSQAGPMRDALAGVRGLTGDESLVTLFECFPCGYRSGGGHGRHSAVRSAPMTSQPQIRANELLEWYERSSRDLPWRDPGVSAWQILVSEFMLQQTPVARVLPIWLDWVRRWPTPSATAAASAADVLRAWGKLGYPRRAKRLHECATVIARDHGDVVPDDVDTLLGLPGIGSYTARAVACFAYRQPVPVVDTNVRRVVARVVHGLADAGAPSATRDHADVSALLPKDDTAPQFSAALMELGATVCIARKPRCGLCPLSECAWRAAGYPPAQGQARRVQTYAGTDRQVRGLLLDVLRLSDFPVTRAQLDVAWLTDTAQRDRALDSLLADGLVAQTVDGLFALAGEE
jgi:A/G-specific adenine glycosylase